MSKNKRERQKVLLGKLVISEKQESIDNALNYGIFSTRGENLVSYTGLTEALDVIYKESESSEVEISIDAIFRDGASKKVIDKQLIFYAKGELYKNKGDCGVYDWFVGDDDLGEVLFGWVGEEIEISITDLCFDASEEDEDGLLE